MIAPGETPDIRPLVVPVEPVQGESLPGLVARATRANILGRPDLWLSGIGMKDARPGFIVLHGHMLAPRLASKIGCTEADIVARSHPFVTPLTASPVAPIKFGSGELIRGDLDLERRRISPLALEQSDHHRSHWLNLLLPYCPESLERLVDRCHCGAKLAWRSAWGIGHCETCREIVRNPHPEFLDENVVEDYRDFADLIAADPEQRQRAINLLEPKLQKLDPASLITLILRIGAALQSPVVTMRRSDAHNLPPAKLAAICATGTRLIQKWPTRLRAAVGEKLEQTRRADMEDFDAFNHRIFLSESVGRPTFAGRQTSDFRLARRKNRHLGRLQPPGTSSKFSMTSLPKSQELTGNAPGRKRDSWAHSCTYGSLWADFGPTDFGRATWDSCRPGFAGKRMPGTSNVDLHQQTTDSR